MALEQWLVEEDLITTDQLQQAQIRQGEAGLTLQMALLELNILDEASLVDLVARKNRLPKAPGPLHRIKVSPKAVSSIPQDLCWQNGVFPFGIDRGSRRLQLAVVDPENVDLNSLGSLSEYNIDLYIIGPKQLEKAIRKHYLDSMVEDTGAGRRRRFFGYDEITDPGMSPTLSSVAPPREERLTPPPLDALPRTDADLQADAAEAARSASPSSDEILPSGSGEIPAASSSGEIPLPEPALGIRSPTPTRQGRSALAAAGDEPLKRVPTPVVDLEGTPIKRTLTPVSVDGDEAGGPVQSAIGAIPTIPKPVTAAELDAAKRKRTHEMIRRLDARFQRLQTTVIQLVDLLAHSEVPEGVRERAHQILIELRGEPNGD